LLVAKFGKPYLKDNQNEFLKTLAYESLNDLFVKSKKSRTYFLTKVKPEKQPETPETEPKSETKVDKLKKRKKQTSIEDSTSYSSDFTSTAFIRLFRVPEFERALKVASINSLRPETEPKAKLSWAEKDKAKQRIKKPRGSRGHRHLDYAKSNLYRTCF
jgi:hypothetical protein